MHCPDGVAYHTLCSDGANHRADFCRADLDNRLGPRASDDVCAVGHLAACGCDCCTCSDGQLPRCPDGSYPFVPAAGPETCDMSSISSIFEHITDNCCEGFDCSDGPPPVCSGSCSDVLVNYWDTNICRGVLEAMPGSSLGDFVAVCRRSGAPASDKHAQSATCDLPRIQSSCWNLADEAGADIVQICGTSCLRAVDEMLDACAVDPRCATNSAPLAGYVRWRKLSPRSSVRRPEVKAQFDAEEWRPVIATCRNLVNGGGH